MIMRTELISCSKAPVLALLDFLLVLFSPNYFTVHVVCSCGRHKMALDRMN